MTEQTQEDTLEDIPLVHRGIVERHGRDCYYLAMSSGLAVEGLTRLDQLAYQHNSKQGAIAVQIVQTQLNKLLAALMVLQGLDAAKVRECQKEILSTPMEGARVQLLH